jgi:TRAP-type C4-dicarboxylate transport system permease small subunit
VWGCAAGARGGRRDVHELLILAIIIVAVMAITTVMAGLVGRSLLVVEYLLMSASVVIILFVMAFVGAEVLMRYAFNAPIPGHLELSELMMPPIVFLAISYTQSTHGHVGMDLVLEALPERSRRFARMGVLIASVFICSVLAYFSFKNTHQLWLFDDVTMTPPYFKTWPSAVAIPIGYTLIALRMFIQVLHLFDPDRFPANEPAALGHSGHE